MIALFCNFTAIGIFRMILFLVHRESVFIPTLVLNISKMSVLLPRKLNVSCFERISWIAVKNVV